MKFYMRHLCLMILLITVVCIMNLDLESFVRKIHYIKRSSFKDETQQLTAINGIPISNQKRLYITLIHLTSLINAGVNEDSRNKLVNDTATRLHESDESWSTKRNQERKKVMMKKQEKTTEMMKEREKTTDMIKKREKNQEMLKKREKTTEMIKKREKTTDMIKKREKTTEMIKKREKTTDMIKKREKTTEIIKKREKTTDMIKKREKNKEMLKKRETTTEMIKKLEKTKQTLIKNDVRSRHVTATNTTNTQITTKKNPFPLPTNVKSKYSNATFTVDVENHEVIKGTWRPISSGARRIYKHTAGYIIENRQFCTGSEISLFIFVESAPRNLKRRRQWRETWGSNKLINTTDVRAAFVVAVDQKFSVNKDILEENRKFGDIIQLNYTDSYETLTKKTITALNWTVTNCAHARFVLKTDDDVIIHLGNMMKHVSTFPATALYTGTRAWNLSPQRSTGKWKVAYEMFPFAQYPPYILGSGIMFSMLAARSLLAQSMYIPLFQFEDIYLGMCAHAAEITAIWDHSFRTVLPYMSHGNYLLQGFQSGDFVLAHGVHENLKEILWKNFTQTDFT